MEDELENLQFDVIGQLGGWRRVSIGIIRRGDINAPNEELHGIREWMFRNLVNLRNAVDPRLEAVMSKPNSDE